MRVKEFFHKIIEKFGRKKDALSVSAKAQSVKKALKATGRSLRSILYFLLDVVLIIIATAILLYILKRTGII